jgi:hypothetical protein
MKVSIRTLKSLKDGRVLIEVGTVEEIDKLKHSKKNVGGSGSGRAPTKETKGGYK